MCQVSNFLSKFLSMFFYNEYLRCFHLYCDENNAAKFFTKTEGRHIHHKKKNAMPCIIVQTGRPSTARHGHGEARVSYRAVPSRATVPIFQPRHDPTSTQPCRAVPMGMTDHGSVPARRRRHSSIATPCPARRCCADPAPPLPTCRAATLSLAARRVVSSGRRSRAPPSPRPSSPTRPGRGICQGQDVGRREERHDSVGGATRI